MCWSRNTVISKDGCGFIERNLAASLPCTFLIETDTLLDSDRTLVHWGPGITTTGLFPGPVQHGSDTFFGICRASASKRSITLSGIRPTRLTSTILLDR
jgi:hypothetical protein